MTTCEAPFCRRVAVYRVEVYVRRGWLAKLLDRPQRVVRQDVCIAHRMGVRL